MNAVRDSRGIRLALHCDFCGGIMNGMAPGALLIDSKGGVHMAHRRCAAALAARNGAIAYKAEFTSLRLEVRDASLGGVAVELLSPRPSELPNS